MLRKIQALPQLTASSAIYMLLGALPVEAVIHERQLSLLHAVFSSDNKYLGDVVQCQLACSFNNEYSFFYTLTHVLEQFNSPTLSSLVAAEIGKEQWKIQCKKSGGMYSWMI